MYENELTVFGMGIPEFFIIFSVAAVIIVVMIVKSSRQRPKKNVLGLEEAKRDITEAAQQDKSHIPDGTEAVLEGKSRHGCLTAWLVLMIIANSASALIYLAGSEAIRRSLPDAPGWAFPVLIVFSLFNVVCAIALFRWKKWGFWGFCVSSVVALVVNLSIGLRTGSVLGGLIGVVLLYGVLHIGKENKGWPQLD